MDFRIADTFTDSLAKLTGDEQKAAKTTAFDLQLNPANPGMQFHKLNAVRDPNFWSVRVSFDIRLIVHRSAESLLLCYAGHHEIRRNRFVDTRQPSYLRLTKAGQSVIDTAWIKAAERLAGKFVVHSNDDTLSADDMVLGYKQLQRVEEAWWTLKSGLRMRPVRH